VENVWEFHYDGRVVALVVVSVCVHWQGFSQRAVLHKV